MAMESPHQSCSLSLDDTLYCEEEKWGEIDDVFEVSENNNNNDKKSSSSSSCLFPLLGLLEQDLFWEDEELLTLFAKEKETHIGSSTQNFDSDPELAAAREEAVDWILKVNAYYGFSNLTAILAINYLHRFLSSLHFQKDKPWMIHLASVTCLSLAAKVEETQVPLLLDLQVRPFSFSFFLLCIALASVI